jgi:hypothetical protein
MRTGRVAIIVKVQHSTAGASNCGWRSSSGNPWRRDALMCQLTVQYVRFAPANGPARACRGAGHYAGCPMGAAEHKSALPPPLAMPSLCQLGLRFSRLCKTSGIGSKLGARSAGNVK